MNAKFFCPIVVALAVSTAGCAAETEYSSARMYSMGRYGVGYEQVPAPDPQRQITEQDCTKPIGASGRNLVCK